MLVSEMKQEALNPFYSGQKRAFFRIERLIRILILRGWAFCENMRVKIPY
jgi:hypothetical protein